MGIKICLVYIGTLLNYSSLIKITYDCKGAWGGENSWTTLLGVLKKFRRVPVSGPPVFVFLHAQTDSRLIGKDDGKHTTI